MTRRIAWTVPAVALLAAGCLTMAHAESVQGSHLPLLIATSHHCDDCGASADVLIRAQSEVAKLKPYGAMAETCQVDDGPEYPTRPDGWCYAADAPR